MTDSIRFQHDGVRYSATLTYNDDEDDPGRWVVTSPEGTPTGDSLTIENTGDHSDALNFLAIRAAHQRQLAQPHLEQAEQAELAHALVTHLAGKVPEVGKAKSRKVTRG